ncbi:MAG: SulP family inorganic anion transporter [Actinobacteria bacterium]|nr:SulP family inorganic anion transporter [Actinomycetota bacterium]
MTDYRPEPPTNTPTEALLEAGQTVGHHLRSLPALLPRAADYAGLGKRWGTELLSGATVGVVALPLALGFGVASGAGATAGIVTAIVAGILAAVFGGSHLQVSGPTGAMTVVLLPVIARHGADKIPLLAVMAGVLLLVLAVAGLGRAVDLIPWPVVEGFTMGIGVIIFLQQLPLALGTAKGESESTLGSAWETLAATDWTKAWLPLLVVALVLAVNLALTPIKRNVPTALVAVVIGTLVAWAFNLDIERIGALPTGLPMPSVPTFDGRLLTSLAAPALAIAALAALESLLSARVADGMAPSVPRTNPDRELFGQGVANLGTGLFGGIPATGAIARTAVNVRSGGRTRVSAVFHSIVLAVVVWTLAPLVSQVPLAALAGVLMWTAIRMINVPLGKRILLTTRADRTTFLLTLVATIALDLVIAVLLGVAMAAMHSLRHMASYSVVRPEHLPVDTAEGLVDVASDELRAKIALYRVDGALFYGNARRFTELVLEENGCRGVILRFHRLQVMDASGADALKQAILTLTAQGVTVIVQGMTDAQLQTAYSLRAFAPDQYAASLPEALMALDRALSDDEPDADGQDAAGVH